MQVPEKDPELQARLDWGMALLEYIRESDCTTRPFLANVFCKYAMPD